MKIAIWGNELIAWTAAACFAEMGNEVLFTPLFSGGDNSESANLDHAPANVKEEPGLIEQLQQQQDSGRLQFSEVTTASMAMLHFLAFLPKQLTYAESLCHMLAKDKERQLIVMNASNFGIGASDKLQAFLSGNQQVMAYIPDQLPAGSALAHFKKPDHLIIGCQQEWALMHIRALYRPFSQNVNSWLLMSAREAEYTKFAITGMLALRLAYINDLANLADEIDVDIDIIRQAMGSDERIGQHYLNPGCGFGGEHFPQYIEGLAGTLSQARNSSLLSTVLEENEKQKELPFRKLWRHYDCNLQGKTISIWGLAFKPGTASISNAPSLKVIDALLNQGCKVQVHDPMAMANIEMYFAKHHHNDQLRFCQNEMQALENSDGLLLLTEWAQYFSPDYQTMRDAMNTALVIDGRNVFDKKLIEELGFSYYGVGR
ncbi:nucleotide sugar dehydrogenase [Pseudoteredinibacter isoporae]|uniref:UDP-glucose 6-dehydrogenase n=1 Tax=Pseudoteredinibacter isoporae TaxID=570281 RepID=A0A7X0JRI8_9GAMM|nr:nucleotide sugar dehydrogenase [Pseudoteredinibacter isoporae]MBB6520974.1 UDPglucose 6-dehydrogenase [Pseudoteredinibacter isoporae]NHO86539.1 UDP-glucose/GDP-mannose dehydrogenase family protein [Pseudoteredinibacter isoporae]NIB25009.1 UDP-glucose/GDP-mannose dehydrogenase family protein [Pseudoteredinibacter isoporae]